MTKTAVVTGASSGIGKATARRLAADGFEVWVGARRVERLKDLADQIGARYSALDVADQDSIDTFCGLIERCHVLVNNAGGAKGREPVTEAVDENWEWMYDVNVLGLMRMTRALLPKLEASGDGHVVNVGSIAGIETYAGGAGYTAAKHAARAVTQTLRLELLGKPIRVTEVQPGLVETEFSLVRFEGDESKAAKVYEGMTALTADDIADCIAFAVTRPSHVNIASMLVLPRDQATATTVHRS